MICRTCYREVPPGGVYCPHCGARLASGDPEPAATSPAPAGREDAAWTNPWEERAERGTAAAFAETLQQTLFHPVRFFRGTAPDRGAGAALLYAVLVGTLSIAVAILWQSALGDRIPFERGGRFQNLFEHRGVLALVVVFVPAVVALVCIASAAVQHVTLAVLGGARGTYRTTLKAVCYSSSALAFNVFPLCGAVVGAIWQVVVQVIGVRELHRTSTARAFWSWFLPLVIATCVAGAVFFATLLGLVKILLEYGGGRFET